MQTTTMRDRWTAMLRSYIGGEWPQADVDAIVDRLVQSEEAGKPSSVWHEVHVQVQQHIFPRVAVACTLCGGMSWPRNLIDGSHALCAAYARRGMPTPKLEGPGEECPCSPCSQSRKARAHDREPSDAQLSRYANEVPSITETCREAHRIKRGGQ